MFEVTVLSTKNEKQWLEILSGFEMKDPHYLPGYLKIYENKSNSESFMHFGGQGMLFVYGNSRNFIIYPFFKRSLSHLLFSGDGGKDLYDIISPYGYGGPLAQIEDETVSEELWRGFFDTFHEFCEESNIVSEFCRLHPIFENHRPVGGFSQGITQKVGQIVYVHLSCSEEEIFAAMSKPHRRHVRRTSSNQDFSFCLDEEQNHPQYFFDLYTATMRRHGAHQKYFFSLDFFNAAFRTLGRHLTFCYLTYHSEIISGMLLLKYGGLIYTWLSGNKPEYFHLYSSDALTYESVLQSKKEGFSYFVLGGGVSTKQDSLFAFKEGFSKLRKDFHVYKRIHLKREYERLVELQGRGGQIPEDFFPRYRLREATIVGHRARQGVGEANEPTEHTPKIS